MPRNPKTRAVNDNESGIFVEVAERSFIGKWILDRFRSEPADRRILRTGSGTEPRNPKTRAPDENESGIFVEDAMRSFIGKKDPGII